jgi:hypothetical protein
VPGVGDVGDVGVVGEVGDIGTVGDVGKPGVIGAAGDVLSPVVPPGAACCAYAAGSAVARIDPTAIAISVVRFMAPPWSPDNLQVDE